MLPKRPTELQANTHKLGLSRVSFALLFDVWSRPTLPCAAPGCARPQHLFHFHLHFPQRRHVNICYPSSGGLQSYDFILFNLITCRVYCPEVYFSKVYFSNVYFPQKMCTFPKGIPTKFILPKYIFAKFTRLACLLSFAKLFYWDPFKKFKVQKS